MTIKVYEVNRDGGIRVVREKVEVDPLPHTEPTSVFPACTCPRCGGAAAVTRARQLPALITLTWDQRAGRACIWCGHALTTGAVSAGRICEQVCAHVQDVEVWACPPCDAGEPPVHHSNQEGTQ